MSNRTSAASDFPFLSGVLAFLLLLLILEFLWVAPFYLSNFERFKFEPPKLTQALLFCSSTTGILMLTLLSGVLCILNWRLKNRNFTFISILISAFILAATWGAFKYNIPLIKERIDALEHLQREELLDKSERD